MSEFQTGDVVQLKSGGPPMTIVEQGPLGTVLTGHFAGDQYQSAEFPAGCLTKLSTAKSPEQSVHSRAVNQMQCAS